jgi:hypothetical protein
MRLLFLALAACTTTDAPPAPGGAPRVHLHLGSTWTDFDSGFCRGSMIPEQDPVFPAIRRDRFTIDPETDLVSIPADWIEEAKNTRGVELRAAAERRVPVLLAKVTELVGRPFDQGDFDYFFYLCPYFGGGTASAKVFPMFMYLRAAVGELQWPDWLFTDQYLFHELLHNYALERIDYVNEGTPILNALYAELIADAEFTAEAQRYLGYTGGETTEQWQRDQLEMVGTVLTHVHVYAAMTAALRALGEETQLETIRSYETSLPSSHPSYVRAWRIAGEMDAEPGRLDEVLGELR